MEAIEIFGWAVFIVRCLFVLLMLIGLVTIVVLLINHTIKSIKQNR